MTVRLSFVPGWLQTCSTGLPINLSAVFTYQYQLGCREGNFGPFAPGGLPL